MARRPLNACRDCDHRWTPRGEKDLSPRCPNCTGRQVYICESGSRSSDDVAPPRSGQRSRSEPDDRPSSPSASSPVLVQVNSTASAAQVAPRRRKTIVTVGAAAALGGGAYVGVPYVMPSVNLPGISAPAPAARDMGPDFSLVPADKPSNAAAPSTDQPSRKEVAISFLQSTVRADVEKARAAYQNEELLLTGVHGSCSPGNFQFAGTPYTSCPVADCQEAIPVMTGDRTTVKVKIIEISGDQIEMNCDFTAP